MITVEEAEKIILSNVNDYGSTSLALEKCMGKILREDLVADRDFPPYDRVTMDGIAIDYQAYAKGQRIFPIAGVAAAGSPQQTLKEASACMEVMTGAIMPQQADTVIRYEDIQVEDGKATIIDEAVVEEAQNVHYKGEDRKEGEVVVKAGTRLSAAEIGVAATMGRVEIAVSNTPKTLIISSGDELVEIHEKPLAHQIRKSNVFRLKAHLAQYGIEADKAHLKDDLPQIKEQVKNFLSQYDIVILSGGVSKGKFDFIPEALSSLGVEKHFHKIKQRPGKPFWFGRHPSGTIVFALPGNPVSSFMCMQRYILPWLSASLGLKETATVKARLAKDVNFKPDLTYLMQVKTHYDDNGYLQAVPVEGHGSGDLANLVDADGFLQLPRGKDEFKAGEVYPLYLYRNLVF